MSKADFDDEDEKPLDPAMESVRRKMIMLQLVSGAVMAVMLMAVLVAIGYKLTRPEPGAKAVAASDGFAVPADQPITARANLPAGFTVTSTSLSGARILFYGTTASGERRALVFDVAAGRMVADITIGEQ